MNWSKINRLSAWLLSSRSEVISVGVDRALEIGKSAPRPWWDERHSNNPAGVDPPAALDFTDLRDMGWQMPNGE